MAVDLPQEIVDGNILVLYEKLMQDKEPEVRSEAIVKLADLAKYCSA